METKKGLSWKNITYEISHGKKKPPKTILENIEGWIEPGEMIAIMGSSGAGKSTLLNILSGRVEKGQIQGNILYNGKKRDPRTFKKLMAYVEQQDLLYPYFTVEETFQFTAKLRLSQNKFTDKDKMDKVDEIIDLLNLDKCRHSKIGNERVRGVSGGEMKRVSVGIELMTEPQLLFLDEPTSGLDSTTALGLCRTLKSICRAKQRSMLVTIHQPSSSIFNLFDKVLLLSQGKMVYFGPVSDCVSYFSHLGFPCPQLANPADHFIDLMSVDNTSIETVIESQKRIDILTDHYKENQLQSQLEKGSDQSSTSSSFEIDDPPSHNLNWFQEFFVLFRRSWLDTFRNKTRYIASFGQAMFMMLLFGFTFFNLNTDQTTIQSRLGLLFFIPVFGTFGVMIPILGVFTVERTIMMRERAAKTYRVSTFYISKLLTEIPVNVLIQFLMLSGIYLISNLRRTPENYFIFVGIIVANVITTSSLGLALGSAVPTLQIGLAIAPALVGIFLLHGGNLVNSEDVPVVFSWLKYASFIYYSYQALMQNEFSGLTFSCPPGSETTGCIPTGDALLTRYNLNEIPLYLCVVINLCIAIILQTIGYILLRNRTKPKTVWL